MKKIKIMLLSLALVAVAGGVLAFKAKYNTNYCVAPGQVVNGRVVCPDNLACITNFFNGTTTDDQAAFPLCWVLDNGQPCPNRICPNGNFITPD